MTTFTLKTIMLASLAAALAACGDNRDLPDARQRNDASPADARCSDCPAAPAIGATQLDRMGRPAINTALNHAFDTSSTAADAAKDAYNADKDKPSWPMTYTSALASSIGVFDSFDTGVCGNGICETGETNVSCAADCTTAGTLDGCGNALLYGTPTMTTSYNALAGLLANDALFLDTSRGTCSVYLAVELGVVMSSAPTTCGGRAPQYDVIDATYSALASGIAGFSTDNLFTPKFNCDGAGMHCGDDVAAHTDFLSAFPYLGEPH
jgi:hypothetical protein